MTNNTDDTNKQATDTAINSVPDSITDQETPESLAEATTAPLADDALGGHATQQNAKK